MRVRPILVALAVVAALAAVIAVLMSSISAGPEWKRIDGTTASTPAASPTGAEPAAGPALCGPLTATRSGRIADRALTEISGLVRSRRDPALLWAVQDSGAEAELIALTASGQSAGRWSVAGASNVDWEDLATAPGPRGPQLFIADIGDNEAARDAVTVWVVDEPAAARGGGATTPAQRLTLRYPGGARDAETLLVDPLHGDLFVVSKELTGGAIYVAKAPLPLGGEVTLERVAAAPLGFETAGDVSADGTLIAVRGYLSLGAWLRRGREPLTSTLRREPCVSPTLLDDGQGETLALSKGGGSATTIAEGKRPPILTLQR